MTLQEFFRWWFRQLKDLLPGSLKMRLQPALCLLYLDLDRETMLVRVHYRNRDYRAEPIAADKSGETQLRAFLEQLPRRPERIILRLAPGRYLRREIELPLAAEQDLAATIGFQIDQLTPFGAEQVVYACGLQQRMPQAKKLRAWLVASPLQQIQQVLQALNEPAAGLLRQPREYPAADAPMQLVYLPEGIGERAGWGGALLLAVLLIGVVGASLTLHINNRLEVKQQLATELDGLHQQAGKAAALRERVDSRHAQIAQLADLRGDRLPFLDLWNDLSQRLDDDTWLIRLDLRGNELTLQGLSTNASQLIEQLQQSPLLDRVTFGSSVTRDRASSNDRFDIKARLRAEPAQ